MTYERFDVVVVPFPFTDSSSSKRRPAVVISHGTAFNAPAGHSVMAMITSAGNATWPLDRAIQDLSAAGLRAPAGFQGLDLLGQAPRAALSFSETDHEGNIAQAVQSLEWKLVQANAGNPRGLPEQALFQLAQDPGETQDRSAAEAARVAELSGQIQDSLAYAQARAVAAAQTGLDAATLQQLRNLGY